MRRVVVRNDLQKQGIASAMRKFCEDYVLRHGFKEIYCHARETAVPFYKKNDYLSEGDYFEKDTIPHLKMRKILERDKKTQITWEICHYKFYVIFKKINGP